MTNWLKGLGISVKVAIGALLMAMAVMAAKRHKNSVQKWRDKAVDAELNNVTGGIGSAKAALSQAKLANARATEAKKAARERLDDIGIKDPELAKIVSGWKSTRINRDG